MNNDDFTPDGYRIVKPWPKVEEKGIQCGKCGMKFEYGKAYGFSCPNLDCPCQMKVTC